MSNLLIASTMIIGHMEEEVVKKHEVYKVRCQLLKKDEMGVFDTYLYTKDEEIAEHFRSVSPYDIVVVLGRITEKGIYPEHFTKIRSSPTKEEAYSYFLALGNVNFGHFDGKVEKPGFLSIYTKGSYTGKLSPDIVKCKDLKEEGYYGVTGSWYEDGIFIEEAYKLSLPLVRYKKTI